MTHEDHSDAEMERFEHEATSDGRHTAQRRSTVGPVALMLLGVTPALYGFGAGMVAFIGPSMCEGSCTHEPSVTGPLLIGALGVGAIVGGAVWLGDINRHPYDVARRPAAPTATLVPAYEPATRTGSLTFLRRF